jgi:hypothetical protein
MYSRFFSLLVFFTLSAVAQDAKQGLIVVHYDPAGKAEFRQKVYSYHFVNGQYVAREELMAVAGKKEGRDYIRTDLGTNQLYKNRYLITSIGNILDLKEKKILFDGRANLVRCSNDSAIFFTNDITKGKFYSVYNFKTNQYGEVKSLVFKAKLGQDVEFDKTTQPYKIYLYPANKPKVLLVSDAGFGQQGSKNDPLMWWLDNSNFVYAYFNKENTELSFYKVNADNKQTTLLGKIPVKPETKPAALASYDNKQALVYLGSKQILVDAGTSTVTDLPFTMTENGFSYECKTNSYGHIVKLNDKEIGKHHFQPKNFRTDKNIAGLVKELVMGEESYQQGLGVWNNNKQTWQSVDCEDVLSLVGWMEE